MMLELTPQVEPLSIDEAFMDLAGTELLHHAPPALSLARLALRIEREIGITVSIGEMVDHSVSRLLDQFGIHLDVERWSGDMDARRAGEVAKAD